MLESVLKIVWLFFTTLRIIKVSGEIFGNNNPTHIEIGSGKGKFIHTLAEKNPNIPLIAMEHKPTVLTFLLDKVEET